VDRHRRRDLKKVLFELFGFFEGSHILMNHQRRWFRRGDWVVSHLRWQPSQEALVERYCIHQHRQARAILVTNDIKSCGSLMF